MKLIILNMKEELIENGILIYLKNFLKKKMIYLFKMKIILFIMELLLLINYVKKVNLIIMNFLEKY